MLEEEYQATHVAHWGAAQPAAARVPFEYSIRDARLEDMPDIREIYNHCGQFGEVTFDEVPRVAQETRSKFQHLKKLGIPTSWQRSEPADPRIRLHVSVEGRKPPIVSPSRTRSTFALRPPEKGSEKC
jgi:hypothetical protein